MMKNNAAVGKAKRLGRLISPDSGKCVIVPLDDSLLSGPALGLERLEPKIRDIVSEHPDAILGFPGLFRNYAQEFAGIPSILNVTASTIRSCHTRKTLVSSIDVALRLGADAVAVHVNIGSTYETEMLHTLGVVAEQCDVAGMPLMAIMYPRSEVADGDENFLDLKENAPEQYTELVSHAARIGMELGADLIKTQYTGCPDSFRIVVDACGGIPIIAAGGPTVEIEQMLEAAAGIVSAGGTGVSFGRNIFGREDAAAALRALRLVVHQGTPPEQAMSDSCQREPPQR